ncbi:MAG: sn-glycerol-3-phosphate ABC transporter ATP-binding protein UgpC [Rhodobacteraceae bacterium]|uniref:Carbohydrate ABC transporter ATP-binding protein, CUT1 family n=1 Tax=Salipiger profundus TaxID=1229727 RepID=A0A1U7D4I9_9RHOB|nr:MULTISPECIES: sn-glycerol-3-phosphate ABC transporter ATP-binding protein UgpC [Salipiger]APX22990.1 carbohydrate ABC transporter ATP-binding protein, CUT1 family [Salipiger profundus]MAB04653.1 sn-glycerol-3-phosphate ABC transporter ATP-binding protein UgpC [Paracoccaceae bacterium]GGA12535.1 ABC transporter ATP-binding protein [Salipiger profundus]SFD21969.1 carbohydrate ABC transporter ATP-binding protein, CUT1 family [Salipiger profundus]
MAEIRLNGIVKDYGAVRAIHGVDLHVNDGEFVAFVGPSGCGKSTMLRMIAGLEEITGGTLDIGGRVVNDVEPKGRDVAMVFQDYALYPHMTIRENIGFGLKMRGFPASDIAPRVEEAAGILQIGDYLDRKPGQLSGGQRQRVAMGRAIVREPSVFLFDEPLSNLDAKLRVEMRTQIKRLHAMLGTTTIYVTHDQTEAMTLADKVVVLRGGHIVQEGPPMELYDRPNSRFVGEFIGSPQMNIFSGTLDRSGGTPVLRSGEVSLPLGEVEARDGAKLDVGIRPEHLDRAPDGQGMVRPVVDVIEPLGSDTMAICRLGEQEVTARLDPRAPLSAGQQIALSYDPANLHYFDGESGGRLSVRVLEAA